MTMRRLSANDVRRSPAFTLLEILVVMVIMALVLGIVVPRAVRLPSGVVFRLAANDFRSVCRNAANLARCGGKTCVLSFRVEREGNRLMDITLEEVAPRLDPQAETRAPQANPAAGSPAATSLRTKGGAFGMAEVSKEYVRDLGLVWLDPEPQNAGEAAAADTDTPYLLGAAFHFYANGEASGPAVTIRAGKRVLQLALDPLTARPIVTEVEP